jgi:A/G-specific adenine glycosylase
LQTELPVKKAKRRTVRVMERCAWMTRDGEVLLEQQNGARWRGLWKLPALKKIPEKAPEVVIEYPFTHHKVTLAVYRQRAGRGEREGCRWWRIEELKEVPMAAGHRRVAELLIADVGLLIAGVPCP